MNTPSFVEFVLGLLIVTLALMAACVQTAVVDTTGSGVASSHQRTE